MFVELLTSRVGYVNLQEPGKNMQHRLLNLELLQLALAFSERLG